MSLARKLRRLMGGKPDLSPAWIWSGFRADVSHSLWMAPAFYAAVLLLEVSAVGSWTALRAAKDLLPLWPVAWIRHAGSYPLNVTLIQSLSLLAPVLALFLWRWRPARVLVFAALFLETALRNSFGKVDHGNHMILLTAFLLIFLPQGPGRGLAFRAQAAAVLNACRTLLLLTYTMSGAAKIVFGVYQAAKGEVSAFHPDAMAIHIASRLLETNSASQSAIGGWLIDHVWIAWPLMLGTIFMQAFALAAAFRPSLRVPWAVALIGFHIMSDLVLTISFPGNCLMLALLFLLHPATLDRFRWRLFLRDLPLFGTLARRFVAPAPL